jgi:hypothetical protein
VLLSAVMTDTRLLEPVRRHSVETQRRLLQDQVVENVVHSVRFAADGLWLCEMLGMPGPEPAARDRLIRHLYNLTRE